MKLKSRHFLYKTIFSSRNTVCFIDLPVRKTSIEKLVTEEDTNHDAIMPITKTKIVFGSEPEWTPQYLYTRDVDQP